MTGAATHGPLKRALLVPAGHFLFRHRNHVFPVVFLILLLGLRPKIFADYRLEVVNDLAGLALAALGSAFRLWTIGLAYIKRGGLNKKVYADTLVTSGMFGVCRNPLYVGNALVLLGLLVALGNPLAIALGIAFFGFAYWSIVTVEEDYLIDKFADAYRAYCAEVPRFLPDFSRYRAATQGMAFNWRRAVQKDYSSIGALLLTFLAYEVVEDLTRHAWRPAAADLAPEAAGIVAVLLAVAAVKLWKKRRPAA